MTNINSNNQIPSFNIPKSDSTNELETILNNIKEQTNTIQNNNNNTKLTPIEINNEINLDMNNNQTQTQIQLEQNNNNNNNNAQTVQIDITSLFSSRISDKDKSIDNQLLNYNGSNNNISKVQATMSEFDYTNNNMKQQIVNDLFDSSRLNGTLTSELKRKYVDDLFNTDINNVSEVNVSNITINKNGRLPNTKSIDEISVSVKDKYIKPEDVINESNEENKRDNVDDGNNNGIVISNMTVDNNNNNNTNHNNENENDIKMEQASVKLLDITNEIQIKNSFVPYEKEFLPLELFDFSQRNEIPNTNTTNFNNIVNENDNSKITSNNNNTKLKNSQSIQSIKKEETSIYKVNSNHNSNTNINNNNKTMIKKDTSLSNNNNQSINSMSNQFQHNANIFANLNMTDILKDIDSKGNNNKTSNTNIITQPLNINNNNDKVNSDIHRNSSERNILQNINDDINQNEKVIIDNKENVNEDEKEEFIENDNEVFIDNNNNKFKNNNDNGIINKNKNNVPEIPLSIMQQKDVKDIKDSSFSFEINQEHSFIKDRNKTDNVHSNYKNGNIKNVKTDKKDDYVNPTFNINNTAIKINIEQIIPQQQPIEIKSEIPKKDNNIKHHSIPSKQEHQSLNNNIKKDSETNINKKEINNDNSNEQIEQKQVSKIENKVIKKEIKNSPLKTVKNNTNENKIKEDINTQSKQIPIQPDINDENNNQPYNNKESQKQLISQNSIKKNTLHKQNSSSSGVLIIQKNINNSQEENNDNNTNNTKKVPNNKVNLTFQPILKTLKTEPSFKEYISSITQISKDYISNSFSLNRKHILLNTNISNFKYNGSSFPKFSPLTIYTDIVLANYLQSQHKFPTLFNFLSSNDKLLYYNSISSYINKINEKGLHKTINNTLFSIKDLPLLLDINISNLPSSYSFWRKISSQHGNSFYISFTFAYIEQLILSKKTTEIYALILDLFRLYDFDRSIFVDVDIYKAKISCNIIYDYLQCGLYNEAIDYLIMCYNCGNDFIKLLVIYVKFCIVIYATDVEVHHFHVGSNANSNYYKENQINFLMKKYALSNFLNKMILYNNEPTYLIFKLIPFIFNVNLTITYLESNSDKQFQTVTFSTNINNNDEDNNDNNNENILSTPVHLGYFIFSYHVLYKENVSNSKEEQDPLSYFEVNNNHKTKHKKTKCPSCKNKSSFICHSKLKYLLCSPCLLNSITSRLKQRIINMINDRFICKEYYLQPIHIELPSTIINISTFDTFLLYKTTFNDYLYSFLKQICFKCNNIYDDLSQLSILKCSCQFCCNCLLTITKDATEGNIIQNVFEKIRQKVIKCFCNLDLNIEQAIEILSLTNDFQECKERAKGRLRKYALGYCMVCKNSFFNPNNSTSVDVSVDSNLPSKRKYHRIKILSNKKHKENIIRGIDYTETEHILCNKCFEREVNSNMFSKGHKKKNSKGKNDFAINSQCRTLFCGVCNIEHDINESEFEGRIKTSCCGQGCIIL